MDYAIENIVFVGSVEYPLYRYTNRDIVLNSLSGVFSVDTVGNELSVDTFALTIRCVQDGVSIYAPVDNDGYKGPDGAVYSLATSSGREYMTDLPYGTPVFWFCDGDYFTKGYLQRVERIGKYAWRLTVISGVGLLADSDHEGGLYAGETAGEILSSIIGSTFPFTIDEPVASVAVNGWLPYDTRRNNLHRVLFALGASLLRGDANTDYTIGFIQETPTPPEIPDSRIALGGKVSYSLPATSAEVTEHSYFAIANDQIDTLFDNTDSGNTGKQKVVFDGPHYDYAATGTLTIEESGVNYAVVSGQGVLTGKAYTHTMRSITESSGSAGTALVKRVTENTLISALNSQNVAKRVLAFYASSKTVSVKLQHSDERCGAMYAFNDAFGDATRAFLQKMTFSPASIKAAQCEFIEGYTPTGQGNFYNNRAVIDTSGTWTVPEGVTRLRVVLIGGGSGGYGGYDGEDGMGGADLEYVFAAPYYKAYSYPYPYQEGTDPPSGGIAGAAGSAGKVLIFDSDVTPGEVIYVTVGQGGTGGANNGGSGAGGTDTAISSASIPPCSSEDGAVLPAYYDPVTEEIFACAGEDGYAGGDGGKAIDVQYPSATARDGNPGGDVEGFSGGSGGAGIAGDVRSRDARINLAPGQIIFASHGGGGGGAAYGADGSPGSDATWNNDSADWTYDTTNGGAGGDGADASAPNKPAYGCGGTGGNGGGAGGNAAPCIIVNTAAPGGELYFTVSAEPGGQGGSGSAGGDGGDGAAIFYY